MVPAPQSRKMHSVFFTIFFSLLLVLVIELTLLIGTIIVGQVPSQLDDNAEEVLCEQVENRSGYLHNFRYNVSVAHGGSHYRRSSGFGP